MKYILLNEYSLWTVRNANSNKLLLRGKLDTKKEEVEERFYSKFGSDTELINSKRYFERR